MTRLAFPPGSAASLKTLAALALAGIAACGGQQPLTTSDADFISVAKDAAVPSTGTGSGSDEFYLAIRKDALGQRYFMSAYLTQLFPGAVSYGAARSLGTRVVTFRLQNGKLFVFDAADIHKDSETFDPSVLVDAYPIVTNSSANSKPGAENYVIFDPSNGLNRFGVMGDAYASSAQYAVPFQVELSFLQRFRTIGDGVTFEQVFSGFATQAINDGSGGEVNALRASGTLGVALRKYSEGKGYQPTAMPDAGEYYFRADPIMVPNTGGFAQPASKWNIYKGMKPIRWVISNHVAALAKDPQYKQYDVFGAMKNSIEAWNDAFGFKVVEAVLATADQSFGDDDTNYVLWDEDPSFGAAFANWRTNPNTGEIRGASVYFNSLWLQIADQIFTDDAVKPIHPVAPPKNTFQPVLVWDAIHSDPLCMFRAPGHRGAQDEMTGMIREINNSSSLTKKQKVEAYIAQTLVHEIGHTFGLRHNFKGSLLPPSSSVMDYLADDDALLSIRPGSYDIAAIRYLYGLSTALPTQPFCTDDATATDPDCNQFDSTDAPLTKWFAPAYTSLVQKVLAGTSNSAPNTTLNRVLQYVRSGTPAQAQQAWAIAMAGISAPVTPAQAGNPTYAGRADILSRRVVQRLYLDPAAAMGNFTSAPDAYSPVYPSILTELKGELTNVDGIRGFTSRRQSVDIAKRLQTMGAYRVLTDGQTVVQSQRAAVTGDAAAYIDDLLARIQAATHPYFN